MQPAGQFEICNAPDTMSAIYSPEGAFLGSMSTKRIETLSQAYRHTTSPEPGDFPQAIAKLIARCKYESKSGTHSVANKNCYTAPPSLTTALISALGATAELFATPFDLNPKLKYYSAPCAEDAEFGAHPDAFIWQGSCYCHPERAFSHLIPGWIGPVAFIKWEKAHSPFDTKAVLVHFSQGPKRVGMVLVCEHTRRLQAKSIIWQHVQCC